MRYTATITIKIDVTDLVEENNYTTPEAENEVIEWVDRALEQSSLYADDLKVEIEY